MITRSLGKALVVGILLSFEWVALGVPREGIQSLIASLIDRHDRHETYRFPSGAELHFFVEEPSLRGRYLYVSADRTRPIGPEQSLTFSRPLTTQTLINRGVETSAYRHPYTWFVADGRLVFMFEDGTLRLVRVPREIAPESAIASLKISHLPRDLFNREFQLPVIRVVYHDPKHDQLFEQILLLTSVAPVLLTTSNPRVNDHDFEPIFAVTLESDQNSGELLGARLPKSIRPQTGIIQVDRSLLEATAGHVATARDLLSPLLDAYITTDSNQTSDSPTREARNRTSVRVQASSSEPDPASRFSREVEVRTLMTELPDSIREVERTILSQIERRLMLGSAVVTGHSGVGKSFWLEWFVKRFREGAVPGLDPRTRFIEVDRVALGSGTRNIGMSEQVVETMLKIAAQSPTIFVIEGLSTLAGMGAHSQSSADFFSLTSNHLDRGTLRILATDDAQKFRDAFAGMSQIERAFAFIDVPSLSRDQTMDVLLSYASSQGFPMARSEAIRIFDYSRRFAPTPHEPGASMELARAYVVAGKQALSAIRSEPQPRNPDSPLILDLESAGVPSLEKVAREVFRVPEAHLSSDRARALLERLRETMNQDVIGQDAAKALVFDQIMLELAEVNRGEPPSVRLLFFGEPGVGKTALAKSVADGLGVRLFEYPMNQYANPTQDSVKKLIESLYGDLATDPFGVFLFDEIEKSHQVIQDVLLQILNDGYGMFDVVRSTGDQRVRRIRLSARNARFIMTTNAGQNALKRASNPLGFGSPNQAAVDLTTQSFSSALIRDGISVPLLDRVSAVPFLALTQDQFEQALRVRIEERLRNKYRVDRGFTYDVKIEGLADYVRALSAAYWNPESSGRDINKILERTLLRRLAQIRLHPSAPERGAELVLRFDPASQALITDFCEGAFLK